MYSALHHIKTLMFGVVIYYNGSKFGCWRFSAVPFPLRAGSLDGLWMLSWMLLHHVSRYAKGCSLCATSNPSNRKLGLYTPLLVPSHPWESISMDFVGGSPMSKNNHDYINVVFDCFSKMCIFQPCKK
jgi:hypothetical protein